MPRLLVALAVILAPATHARGYYTQYKHETIGPTKDATNLCYQRLSGWNGWGLSHDDRLVAFQGDVHAVNAALAAFATLPVEGKEVRLFPGPGSVTTLGGKAIACDWELRLTTDVQMPRGDRKELEESRTAVLTLYLGRAGPIPPADPRAGQWVKELDDDDFRVRENASRALADLSDSALPVLRDGLSGASPEQRRRIEQLLNRLRPVHLSRVAFPSGLRVVCLDHLVERQVANWRSGDLARSWKAVQNLGAWAEYSEDTLPVLVEALGDIREMVRDQASAAFARLGKRASSALPGLRALESGPLPSGAREAVRKAIESVTSGEEVFGDNRRLRAAITDYCRANKLGS
jgi:hypothetical protein